MRLKSFSKLLFPLILLLILTIKAKSEDQIDIWNKEKSNNIDLSNPTPNQKDQTFQKIIKKTEVNENIIILESEEFKDEELNLYGIFDPDKNNFNLNMWKKSDGEDIKKIIKRIGKIKLSESVEDLFVDTILTYSYSPNKNMTEDEFLKIKFDWLIENKKDNLLEQFLNKNKNFNEKKRTIQYLVDRNISKANLKEGCDKSEFISKDIKDPYLEKFKIYCLIFNDKKNEAQLIHDILKEQKKSDQFFDSKINYLLGINDKPDDKIKDDNLLNFYLSSITVPNFSYKPDEKTDKFIWEYLSSANLVEIEDIQDKERIKILESAANKNTINKIKIFEIYKKIKFDLNSLINAENIYQSFDNLEARALIYQKFLLSDNAENKIKLLITLKELFKKDNLSNVYSEFLSDRLKELMKNDIPGEYINIVEKNIINKDEYKLGRIKFDDKILHRSRVVRYFTEENTPKQRTQKDLNSIYKKIKRNKSYFFSAKDLALIESLEVDEFEIPKEFENINISNKYSVPESLLELVKNEEFGLLALKFVEIIGEDEISNLDPETIYFIVNILNKAKLINFRNKVLNAALPLRV